MTQKPPSVSIVVPLYNKATSVEATLSSVLSQSMSDVEVIVVDDGSTDTGPQIVATFTDKRLRLFQQQNAGVSAARNAGVHASRADWIAFIDADDVWDSNHLEILLRASRCDGVIVAFSNVRLQRRPERPAIRRSIPAQKIDDYFAFALSSGGYPISSSSVLVRRDRLLECGLFKVGQTMGEDIDMWCRLACCGSFFYSGAESATYNDIPTANSVAGALDRDAVYPQFAQRLVKMFEANDVPMRLVENAQRYANFLLLEYARQLLDRGKFLEARSLLLKQCRPNYDFKRFAKRLLRTSPIGHAIYALSRRI